MTKKLFAFLPVILLVVFAFSLRWWHIGSVAPGISNDELGYTLNAKSFFLTGTDLAGTISPLQVLLFKYPPSDPIQAELPYLLQLPFDGPFPFSLPLERLPYVLMSLGTVLLLYGIAKELFGQKTGVIAGLVASINPYLVVVGRTTYEVVPATFFFLLALYLIIKVKGAKILLILPVLFCAFYSYIGTKVAFLPFVFLLSLFGYFFPKQKSDRKYSLVLSLIAIVFVGFYLALLHTNNSGVRLGEILTPNNSLITQQVDAIRKDSLNAPLNSLFVNKYTIYATTLVNSFLTIFSTPYLFQYGDAFFRLYNHGVLYYIDGIFLLLGIVFLFQKKRTYGLFLIAFCLVGTIPQVLHADAPGTTNYAHSSLLFPFLVLVIASGIAGFLDIVTKPLWKKIATVGVIILYTFSFLFFVRAYFFRYPLAGKEDFSIRILSRYAVLAQSENKQVYVLSSSSKLIFRKYLFYANAINKNTIQTVKDDFHATNMRIGNIIFMSCTSQFTFPKSSIVIEDVLCGKTFDKPYTKVPLVADGGTAYQIYQDSLCSSYSLKQFPYGLKLSDFEVEKLPKQTFCETFITR